MAKWLKIGLDTSTASCLRNIKKYDDEAQKKIHDGIKSTTEAIADKARRRVNVVSGRLVRSIKTDFNKKQSAGYVKTDAKIAPHAHLVEFGTQAAYIQPKQGHKALKIGGKYAAWAMVKAKKARPFMKPSAEEEKTNFAKKIEEAIGKK